VSQGAAHSPSWISEFRSEAFKRLTQFSDNARTAACPRGNTAKVGKRIQAFMISHNELLTVQG